MNVNSRGEMAVPPPRRLSGAYKAEPIGSSWRGFGQCRFGVSVGQPYHEGEKLKAVIDWVNRRAYDPFRAAEILLGDSLQRHNGPALLGLDIVQAREQAVREGEAWIARNTGILEAMAVPWRLVRWDEVLADPRFEALRTRLENFLGCDRALAVAMRAQLRSLVDRRQARGEAGDVERFIRGARTYLLEELAVIAIRDQDFPAANCYPGSWGPIWQAARGSLARGMPAGLVGMETVELRFSRRRKRAAQATPSLADRRHPVYPGEGSGRPAPTA